MRKLLVCTCVSGVETHVPADSKHPGGSETAFTVRLAGMLTTFACTIANTDGKLQSIVRNDRQRVVYREEIAPMLAEPFLLH